MRQQEIKLKAQMAEDEAMAQMGASLAAGISQVGKGIGQYVGIQKENAPYNQALNQMANMQNPPRAGAVNPDIQARIEALGFGVPTQPFTGSTGGKTAFDVQMRLQDQMAQRMNEGLSAQSRISSMDAAAARLDLSREAGLRSQANIDLSRESGLRSQANLDLAKVQEQRMQDQIYAQRAAEAAKLAGTKYDEAFKQADAYNQGMRVAQKALGEAKTQAEYDAASNDITARYMAGQKLGLKVEAPQIPTFVTPQMQRAVREQQGVVDPLQTQYKSMTSDWIPNMFGGDEATQRQLDEEQKKLESLPGYRETRPGYRPPGLSESMIAPYPSREEFAPQQPVPLPVTPVAQQGTAPQQAAPAQTVIPLSEAKKVVPGAYVGQTIYDKDGNSATVGP